MTSQELTRQAVCGRRVYALIAAAGTGSRLGAQVPKSYVLLRGKSLLERSVIAMITSEIVDEIVVLVSAEMFDFAHQLLSRAQLFEAAVPVRLVVGGGERADSVWAGVRSIPDEDAVVLIHDAARALTPPGMIARVTRAVLEGAPAVIPVLPVSDTIKKVAGSFVVDTPNRADLRAVQTPQAFDLALLRAANEKYFAASNPGFVATDDASLMEWCGVDVRCVPGDPMALKITTPLDYTLAAAVVDQAEPTIFEVPDV
ncbi:2-C-methyl-D-erythritol 4-phosphate cytidylyltransferase [Corynebacterium felinum]|uniref:2-C-methyl-D-erythritol 4-phosphate cytidylyltransferase n=1 Tax=Corynebacterium felinum TaxID=131318 RepID=A0ABU2B5A5_9CORY|nr:2-C-methyl-D-erythritol 4-phosphate cytidylyltransferase [Corynebacterium felinum]MDF5821446.1 2-C-methyl-D-erythritol 4-phosphate cytidylyltransferase [Corynebacterium felinum]MDR7353797.1 2-C-methyl-D-erythritol 4-phosphate cytidylyltransferase [Corynebacterium felinum]WJY95976.1 2-C-methyl-D-erythritol 4-phosphate cytidylyltransferase [Corynebacterium felinum]